VPFAYGALTRCGATFQNASTRHQIGNSVKGLVPLQSGPTTPNWQRHQALPPARFGLFPFRSPLLRESLLLSSPRGTEMFQFPRFPLPALCVQTGVTPHDGRRVSPFGYPRIEAWSAAPRGFSQPPTSFIGFRRQGIHRWLFVAWKNKDARARYGVLKGQTGGAAALRPSKQPAAGQGRRELLLGRRALHSLKTEQRIAWSLARPDPGGSRLQGDNCLRRGQTRKAPSQ
jgi:hypothetical protein